MKGQATIFIILGIIIFSVATLIVVYRESIFGGLKMEFLKAKELSEEVNEINNFVDGCIDNIANEGLSLIGLQGGYIINPSEGLPSLADPFSNKLSVNGLEVAYWFYQKANGINIVKIPGKEFMEEELANYVRANLKSCTNEFRDFPELSITEDDVLVDVNIKSESIDIMVGYPIIMEKGDVIEKIRNFNVNLNVPLGELYNIAEEIMNEENNNPFLEQKTLDLLIVNDDIPFSGVDFECKPRAWSKHQVAERLKDLLEVNLGTFRIEGTNFNNNIDDYFVLDLLSRSHKDVNINLQFNQKWPFLIDIEPSEGDILIGDFINKGIGRFLTTLFCMNNYHFIYDIKYPVLVTLTKNDYLFQFATQVIIDNNQERENEVAVEQSYNLKSKICSKPVTNMEVSVFGINPDNSLLPLENAKISLKCSTATCEIGNTNEFGLFNGKFPQCVNGLLQAEAEGFDMAKETVSTNIGSSVSLLLEPINTLNVSIMVVDNFARGIASDESIILELEHLDSDYRTSIIYPSSGEIKLIGGAYNVKTYLTVNSSNGIIIPSDTLRTCIDAPKKGILGVIGITEKKCVENKLESVELEQMVIGGVEFNWFVSRRDLFDAEEVTFYVVRNKLPKNAEELGKVYESILTNNQNKNFRLPMLR